MERLFADESESVGRGEDEKESLGVSESDGVFECVRVRLGLSNTLTEAVRRFVGVLV